MNWQIGDIVENQDGLTAVIHNIEPHRIDGEKTGKLIVTFLFADGHLQTCVMERS